MPYCVQAGSKAVALMEREQSLRRAADERARAAEESARAAHENLLRAQRLHAAERDAWRRAMDEATAAAPKTLGPIRAGLGGNKALYMAGTGAATPRGGSIQDTIAWARREASGG